ncbi:MAG TPA: hypothetical protein VF263_13055 [Longimicrobiaceae bacterium]
MLYYLLFIFVAFGSKLLLGLVTIFLLLDSDSRCSECDGETILLRMGPLGRTASWLMFGQIQRRWCPRCGWEGTTRPCRSAVEAGSAVLPRTPTV